MAPRGKRKQTIDAGGNGATNQKKRLTKVEREQLVCSDRLKAIEQLESLSTEDRFSQAEKSRLLDAYNQHGFQAFQDMHLLQEFFPHRSETNLKGLLNRLKTRLQRELPDEQTNTDDLNQWQRLCINLMGNFARDKRVNLDDVLADALLLVAEERELNERRNQQIDTNNAGNVNQEEPNYPELLRSFAQLLSGKFPENMTPANARISMRLFDHVNGLVDSMDIEKVSSSLEQGSWLNESTDERRKNQEMALIGLEELDRVVKGCPTVRDVEKSRNIEALCLEMPKIKRITELLNPLHINESLVSGLIDI